MQSRSLMIVAALVAGGCAIPASIRLEPAHARDVGDAAALGLRRGEPLRRVVERLRTRGATGLALSAGVDASDPGTTLHVLTADHLGAVLLFRDLRYAGRLALGADRGSARGLYLKLVRLGRANVVLVASDALTVGGDPGLRLLTVGSRRRVLIGWDYFPEWSYGMKDPLIVGDDLAVGVTFVARMPGAVRGSHVPWHRGVILAYDGKRPRVEPVHMQRLLSCRCIDEWFSRPRAWRRGQLVAGGVRLGEGDGPRR